MRLDAKAFHGLLSDNPIIAAVKDYTGLEKALASDTHIVFVLFGSITSMDQIARQIKDSQKVCMIHLDLVDGLSARDPSVDFIQKYTCADGIISTRPNLVKKAASSGLLAIQRFFLLDSMAIANIKKQYPDNAACAMEILPGLMPKIIHKLSQTMSVPIIAGGLINDKEDVVNALAAGACAVSSTNPEVWFL